MTMLRQRVRAVLVMAFALLLAAGCASESAGGADGQDTALAGETIHFVVPFSPGGGYDSYARLIAPHLEDRLGATVIVENQEGAGGLLAINNLLTENPDGTTIAIMNGPGAGGASIAGAPGAQFSLDELTYLGLFNSEGNMLVVGPNSPFRTFDQLLAAPVVRIGTTGPGAADYINANVMTRVFGLKAEIVSGFAGSSENALAVTRGDVDMMAADYGSDLPAVQAGDHTPLIALSTEPLPELADVPLVLDRDLTADQREILEAHLDLVVGFERPIVAPPGMEEDRRNLLRSALAEVAADPAFQEEVVKQGRSSHFTDGQQTDALVQNLLGAPQAYVDLVTAAYAK
jgi:tripartite-type tricarboxylate transporter receptor subunit TctC